MRLGPLCPAGRLSCQDDGRPAGPPALTGPALSPRLVSISCDTDRSQHRTDHLPDSDSPRICEKLYAKWVLTEAARTAKESGRRSTRRSRLVLPKVAAVQSLSHRGTFTFLMVRLGQAAFVPDAHGTVLNHSVCPFGQTSVPGLPPCHSFAVGLLATKLADNCKKLQIKNPQKTPLKIVSLIDISRSREQNCCVLLGSQTLGAEFYSALSLSSHPTI